MADSIKEKILKDVSTTLKGITTPLGFDNTIKSVQRYEALGQSTIDTPYVVIVQGDESILGPVPDPLVSKKLSIHLDVITVHDPADTRSGDEVMNSLEADIERALQADPSRAGNATDTSTLEVMPLVVEKNSSEINSIMSFEVEYRQVRKNPKSI